MCVCVCVCSNLHTNKTVHFGVIVNNLNVLIVSDGNIIKFISPRSLWGNSSCSVVGIR